jgi:hypothetical protein
MLGASSLEDANMPQILVLMGLFAGLGQWLQHRRKERGPAWLLVPMLLCYALACLATVWLLLAVMIVLGS